MNETQIPTPATADAPARKTRSDSVLGNLPSQQQQRIIQWLGEHSYAEVLAKIAAPPPDGLGLQVPYTSLQRFYTQHLPETIIQDRQTLLARLKDAAALLEIEPAPYDALAKESLQRHLFLQSLSPEYHGPRFSDNVKLLLQWRAQELKEKYFELHQAAAQAKTQTNSDKPVVQVFAGISAPLRPPPAHSVPLHQSPQLPDPRPPQPHTLTPTPDNPTLDTRHPMPATRHPTPNPEP